jgi:hypothetical protein
MGIKDMGIKGSKILSFLQKMFIYLSDKTHPKKVLSKELLVEKNCKNLTNVFFGQNFLGAF